VYPSKRSLQTQLFCCLMSIFFRRDFIVVIRYSNTHSTIFRIYCPLKSTASLLRCNVSDFLEVIDDCFLKFSMYIYAYRET
jgi:hypothetical protein